MRRPKASLLAVLVAVAAVRVQAADPPKYEEVTLTGTTHTLAEVLKPTGLPFDPEPVAGQVVLKTDDGTVVPLLSEDASRALFRDERLRHKRTEIKGRRHPGLPYLQVLTFRVEDGGRLRTPEYYCEICTIHVRYPQICPCCQGPMELRMQTESR